MKTTAHARRAAPAADAPAVLQANTVPAPDTRAASQATIALLQAHSLTSAVHAEIERLILAGELAPGVQLIEAHFAERLGVSRGPIREAFRILEEAGLVRQEKNRGVFVRSIAPDEAADIYDLRAMLEESAGRQLAERIAPDQLRQLRTMVEQMERVVRDGHEPGAGDQYHLLNLAFHETLVDFVGNRKLSALYRRLVKELSLLRRVNLAGGRQMPASASEHRGILKAIAAGDAEAAGRALRVHVLESKERALRQPSAAGQPIPTPSAAPAAPRRTLRHA
jgi:phosphonate utilization transcriptional regulator